MISSIFTAIGEAITGFVTALSSALNGVQAMFITTGTGGTASLTLLGSLSLIAVGVGVVYFCFRLIKGLISRRA